MHARLCVHRCLWLRGGEGLGFTRGLGTPPYRLGTPLYRLGTPLYRLGTPLYIQEEWKEDFFSYGVSFLINTRSLSAVCVCVCRRCVRACVGGVCVHASEACACECRMCVHEFVGGAWSQDTTVATVSRRGPTIFNNDRTYSI